MRFVKTAENIFGLPAGFQRAEYLQSTGTQWIDTGYKLNSNSLLEVSACSTDATQSNNTLLGVGTSAGSADRVQVHFGSAAGTLSIRLDGTLSSNQSIGTNKFISKIDISNKKAYFNDIEIVSNYTGSIDTTDNIALFNRMISGNVIESEYAAKAKVYYLRISENNALVRDFIPCIDPLGVPCMYDLVGKKPYYNIGTGTFTAGRQVIPVDYLESTGTQYIDTGVGGDLTTELTCEAAIVQAGNASVTNIMGNNVTSTRAITINMSANIANPSPSRIRFGNTDNTTEAGAINLNTFYKYSTNKNELTVRDSSGTVLNTYPLNATTAFTTNGNILIYKLGDTSTQYIGKIKVKGATIKNNGVLVRDFIPCKDENNVGFMFDTISGTVYLNSGTGAFSFGENKYTSKLRLIRDAIRIPEGYTRVEYLESTGTQYINTGYIPTNTTGVQVRHTICADNGTDNILFGCRQTSGNNRFWEDVDWGGSDNIGWGFNEYSNNVSGYRCPLTSDMIGQTVISSFNFMNDRACKVNGVLYDPSVATKTLATITRPIYLFAANNQGNAGYFNACKIFSCQISEGSTLVRSFIPVRDENNVGYMFDEMTGQLFGNAGSGSFGIGNDLPTAPVRFIQDVLPREYRPLKYLKSTGTQWIDTGVYGNLNTKIEAKVYSERVSGTDSGYCIAGDFTTSTKAITMPFNFVGDALYSRFGDKAITTGIQQQAGTYTFAVDKGGYYVDGTKIATFNTTTSFTTGGTIMLFGFTGLGRNYLIGNMYKCIIWDNGVPVRDLYPALRKSDNKPGMYDRITKQFFVNQGTGDFNYE